MFEIPSINWVDNSGAYPTQSHKYQTPYYVFDICLAAMFVRAYFFCLAVIMFSPVNERLYGKRVCQNAGFEPVFSFQVKAGMRSSPIFTFALMSVTTILSLAYMIRIFERPYYTFNFYEEGLKFYNFEHFASSLWFVIITMSSVGYGGIIATTPVGRGITIVTSIVGAFLLSLLVAIITDWFMMSERKAQAIGKMQTDRLAATAVRAGF